MTTSCFGDFAVTDDIGELEWYGENEKSIFKFYGLIGMIVTLVSCSGLIAFKLWVRVTTRSKVKECLKELHEQEANWKEQRLIIVREWGQTAEGTTLASEKIEDINFPGPSWDQLQEVPLEPEETATQKEPIPEVRQQNLDIVRAEAASTDLPEGPIIPSAKEDRLNVSHVDSAPTEEPSKGSTISVPAATTEPAAVEIGSTSLPHQIDSPPN